MKGDEVRKGIDDAFAAVRSLHRDGKLSDDLYHKSVVCLAYEYAVLGEMLACAATLQLVPVTYSGDVMRQQMREDEAFRVVATTVARKLVEAGLVDLGRGLVPTQKGAQA